MTYHDLSSYLAYYARTTVEATEEAIYNSLFKATPTTGFDGATIVALPIGAVKDLMRKHGYPAQ